MSWPSKESARAQADQTALPHNIRQELAVEFQRGHGPGSLKVTGGDPSTVLSSSP